MAEINDKKEVGKVIVKKEDFVELKYTGYSDGKVFDSNIPEDLKKLDSTLKVVKTVVVIGESMLVPGFDKALEGKEIDKEYEIELFPKDGFGERRRELIKTIPSNVFREKEIIPRPGLVLNIDEGFAKIIAVSGGRVITDFNNPMAGKQLKYKFKIVRKIEGEKEKAEALFEALIRIVPEIEIKDKIIVRGPKELDYFVNAFNDRFKRLIGKDLKFELKTAEKDKKDEMKAEVKKEKINKEKEKDKIKEEAKMEKKEEEKQTISE